MTPSITSDEYRLLKEQHVTGHSGSSTGDILSLLAVAPAGLFLNAVLISRIAALQAPLHSLPRFVCEFATLALPCLLSYTLLSSHAWAIITAQLSLACIVAFLAPCTPVPPPAPTQGRPPFITHFRGALMMATWVCILAVDFNVFPRRLAKTEAFGVSLMDMGVGMMVFSSGFVASSRGTSSFARDVVPAAPLLLLAGIKIVANAATNYQVHESEYGTHWNFFATLCVLALLHASINACLRWARLQSASVILLVGGVAVTWLHQRALQSPYEWDGRVQPVTLQEFILTAARSVPRHDTCRTLSCFLRSSGVYLLTHNREGIFGCAGFASLYLIARGAGGMLQSSRLQVSTAHSIMLCACVLFSVWSIHATITQSIGDVSRRLVNAPYVSWITSMAATLFVLMWVADAAAHDFCRHDWRRAPATLQSSLLAAINSANLAAFMLANMGTGIVNFTVHTLFATDVTAMVMLTTYMLCVSGVVFAAATLGIKLKAW